MSSFQSEIGRFVSENEIPNVLAKIHPKSYISSGTHRSLVPGTVKDIEWNHLDQTHRIYLHDAYHDAVRLTLSKDTAFSISRWKSFPIFIPVFDARVGRGLFYQNFCVFGLILCHQICRLTQVGENVDIQVTWYTMSSRWLKWLHRPFNTMLLKLQQKQDNEDLVVRVQRKQLRSEGVSFKTDEPNYLNSNVLTDMVVYPLPEENKFDIGHIPLGRREEIKMGAVKLHILRTDDKSLEVWPGRCPHEGAELPESCLDGKIMSCPWHGRKFPPVRLRDSDGSSYTFGNLKLSLRAGILTLTSKEEKTIPTEITL